MTTSATRTVTARDQQRVLDEIARAKRRLGLQETAPIVGDFSNALTLILAGL